MSARVRGRALGWSGVLLLLAVGARADLAWRAPTPAEKAVIERYDQVLSAVLDQFRGDDWNETVDYEIQDPAARQSPEAPLQIDKGLERTYDTRPGSERWTRLIAPKTAEMQKAGSPGAMAKVGRTIQALMHVHVSAEFNVINSAIDPPPPANPDLHIPGAALTYRVDHPDKYPEKGVVLLFGAWRAARWDPKLGVVPFRFVHPRGTPFIENIEVRIGGTEDRVNELLHSIDWRKVDEALSP